MGNVPDVEDAGIETFYAHVGEKLRLARTAAAVSQDVLAQRVGLTRPSIANIEAGRQRVALHLFVAICQALDKEVCEFLPEQSESHHSPISTDIEEELADSPKSMQRFVHEAVARRDMGSDGEERP